MEELLINAIKNSPLRQQLELNMMRFILNGQKRLLLEGLEDKITIIYGTRTLLTHQK